MPQILIQTCQAQMVNGTNSQIFLKWNVQCLDPWGTISRPLKHQSHLKIQILACLPWELLFYTDFVVLITCIIYERLVKMQVPDPGMMLSRLHLFVLHQYFIMCLLLQRHCFPYTPWEQMSPTRSEPSISELFVSIGFKNDCFSKHSQHTSWCVIAWDNKVKLSTTDVSGTKR